MTKTVFALHNVCAVHRGCAVQWGMFSTLGGNYHEYSGGYHEYTGGCLVHWGISRVHRGYHDKCGKSLGKQLNLYGNPSVLNIPWCTHDILHTHHGIPQCTPSVLNTPAVLMTSPTLIMVFPSCTHGIPQVYWTRLRCTAQTLCRVVFWGSLKSLRRGTPAAFSRKSWWPITSSVHASLLCRSCKI